MAKYLKRDTSKGYVEDYVDVQALKFDNVRHTTLGNMLGDYDNQGYYRVHPDIVNELILMPKYVVEVMDNLEICLSTIKLDKQISFLVAYEGERATLSLIEKVSFESNNKLDSGVWSNVNEYVLDIVETSGEIDRQALYLKWNIQTFPGNIIDIFSCDESVLEKYFNIVNRFKYNMEAKSILLDKEKELEEIEAEYALDLFEILSGYPELKKKVEKQIKSELTEKKDFVKLDKPNFTKTINEVLEKAIENNVGCLSEFEKNNFEIEKRNAKVKSNIKKFDTLNVKEEKIEKTDEIELDADLNATEEQSKVVVKMEAKGYKFKTFEGCAQSLAKKEKEAANNATNNAVEILLGKSKTKVAQVVDAILKTGVATDTIVSAPVIAVVEGKKTAEQAVKQTVTDAQKAVENIVAPTKKSETKKPEVKKPQQKKPEKKKVEKGKSKDEKPEAKDEKEKDKATKGTSSSSGGVYGTSTKVKTESANETSLTSTKTLKAEKDIQNNQSLIGKRVEEDKKRNSLTVATAALEHEDQKEKAATNLNVNTVGQNLAPKTTPNPGALESKVVTPTGNLAPKTPKVTVVTTQRRVSVRTSTTPIDRGLGL